MARCLVTGAAGFIGYHLSRCLLERGDSVVGLDNLNDYYDVNLKQARLARLQGEPGFAFVKLDLADRAAMEQLFAERELDVVVNLAAQVGVRYSLTHPHAYVNSNVVGFLNVLEGCRRAQVRHLVFASSSSVYGANTRMPFSVHDCVDHPVSLYAASKKSNELMAHSYAYLYGLPCTGLRFFTVYGPWGRPDMALSLFTHAILQGKPVDLFNYGRHKRDFTYVEDIAKGVARVLDRVPKGSLAWTGNAPDPATSCAPYRLYNIGSHRPVELLYLVELLEKALGRNAKKNLLPMQPGDVPETYADVGDLTQDMGFRPETTIEDGVVRFVDWYLDFYSNKPTPRLDRQLPVAFV